MKHLNPLIDSNQAHFNSEVVDFLSAFDAIDNFVDTDYKARWLLSDVHSEKWIIRTPKTGKKKKANAQESGEEYTYTVSVNWCRELPDGSFLTDKVNQSFLTQLQKLFFLIVDDPIEQDTMASKSVQDMGSKVLTFVSWLYLHKERFDPNKYGLSKLSQSDIKQFCKEVIGGGVFGALRYGHRFMSEVGINLESQVDPLNLDANTVEKAILLFKKNGFYKENIQGKKVINRTEVYKISGLSKHGFYGHSGTWFFRQFEPELLEQNGQVLLPVNQYSDFPSHKTPLIKDIKNKIYTDAGAKGVVKFFKKGFLYWEMFVDFFPNPDSIKIGEISSYISRKASPTSHTPWIPLETSLLTLNKSIDMILNHADKIVELYEDLLEELDARGHLDKDNNYKYKKSDVLKKTIPDEIKNKFNVVSFSRLDEEFKKSSSNEDSDDKKGISFVCLLEILKASCFILIAGLKPIRMEEIVRLPYNCLFHKEGDGYWMVHDLMKSGTNDELPETAKPIPKVTAKAIQTLQKINHITQAFANKPSKHETGYLLYQLNTGSNNREGSILDSDAIIGTLERFCDFYRTAVDEHGRRWYINIHEMRKTFLLTFFWTFKHSSIDACRWIAGHADPEHVLAYIESNNPGAEMTEIEADYARQQIAYFHEKSALLEMQNTEELYQLACKHFKVKDYTSIPEDELAEYIKIRLIKGKFSIVFYSVSERNGLIEKAKVAFKVVKKDGESNDGK
ncbi:hypothetical protein AB4517_06535 [Vibrio sp. 10N.222.52.C3]|uniref:hypothetical protein n=1 Tax=Vibrio sp. 10N.222.52.C3 TaxID=3229631 RepID=UPI00354EC5FD